MMSQIGDPEKFTKDNITDIKNILFLLPNRFLMQMEMEETIDEL